MILLRLLTKGTSVPLFLSMYEILTCGHTLWIPQDVVCEEFVNKV